MKLPRRKIKVRTPMRIITLSFAAVILLGTFLLGLPVSSRNGVPTPFLDCLFTATSATCVTGLIVYDTYTHWSPFGQAVILLLIQIGGLGLVTFTTFFNIMLGKKLGLRSMHLAQESISSMSSDVRQLVGMVVKTALAVEAAGAILFACAFVPKYGPEGIFISIFTAVSAFCNAGFDLFGRHIPFSSLCTYDWDAFVLGVAGFLILSGGIGFIVIHDLLQKKKSGKLTLHTRVVLCVTGILMVGGMLVTAFFEWNNPATLGSMSVPGKVGASWFHSVSCRTAGFNCFDMAAMYPRTKLTSCILMFIGAAPGSTGGGIKLTTVAVIVMTVISVIRGQEDTVIFRRKVDKGAVYKSLAVVVLALTGILITTACIVYSLRGTGSVSTVDALFESVSAFATVGLSVGVTGIAGPVARLLLIFCMYLGRLGPVTFFLSLAYRTTSRREILPEGKIVIG